MSRILDIADAVVAALNDPAAGFDPPLAAQRAYMPEFSLEDLATRRVTVVPRSVESELAGRNASQYAVAVDIAVQQKIESAEAQDGLMDLVEKIELHLRHRRLPQYPSAQWQASANSPIYSVEHLRTKGVFTSVLTLTYRVIA